jgi:hypothetical protein
MVRKSCAATPQNVRWNLPETKRALAGNRRPQRTWVGENMAKPIASEPPRAMLLDDINEVHEADDGSESPLLGWWHLGRSLRIPRLPASLRLKRRMDGKRASVACSAWPVLDVLVCVDDGPRLLDGKCFHRSVLGVRVKTPNN